MDILFPIGARGTSCRSRALSLALPAKLDYLSNL